MTTRRYELMKLSPTELKAMASNGDRDAFQCLVARRELEETGGYPFVWRVRLVLQNKINDGLKFTGWTEPRTVHVDVEGDWIGEPGQRTEHNEQALSQVRTRAFEAARNWKADRVEIVSIEHASSEEAMACIGMTKSEYDAITGSK